MKNFLEIYKAFLDFTKQAYWDRGSLSAEKIVIELPSPKLPTEANGFFDTLKTLDGDFLWAYAFLPELFFATAALSLFVYILLVKTQDTATLCFEHFLTLALIIVALTLVISGTGENLGFNHLSLNNPWKYFKVPHEQFDWCAVLSTPTIYLYSPAGLFVSTGSRVLFKGILLGAALMVLLLMRSRLVEEQINKPEIVLFLLYAIFGGMLMIDSSHFLSFFIAYEIQSFCLYLLAAAKTSSSSAISASLKYFLLGIFCSAFFLLGVALLLFEKGTAQFHVLSIVSHTVYIDPNFIIGFFAWHQFCFILILVPFLFKLSIAPFHFWVADVYDGIPTTMAMFFSIIPKISLIFVLFELFNAFNYSQMDLHSGLEILAVVSIISGTLLALNERKLKSFWAYSSIAHSGYFLLALCSGSGLISFSALTYYLIIYVITGIGFWTMVIALDTPQNFSKPKTWLDFAGIGQTNPLLGYSLVIICFSLAGIPPLAGFWAKVNIFLLAFKGGLWLAILLAAGCSIIAGFFYIRLVKIIFFEQTLPMESPKMLNSWSTYCLFFVNFFLIFLFLYPAPLLTLIMVFFII